MIESSNGEGPVLSQTAQYALRAVIHIAEQGAERPVPVSDIAQALEVPRNYLSKTLHQLARAGIVASTFGPGGGFRLAHPADALTLDAVVAPFDNAGERHCLLGRAVCSDASPCAAHGEWKAISVQIHEFFAHTTVAQLARDGHPELLPPRAPRPSARGR
jgi:Rrf2 family protein